MNNLKGARRAIATSAPLDGSDAPVERLGGSGLSTATRPMATLVLKGNGNIMKTLLVATFAVASLSATSALAVSNTAKGAAAGAVGGALVAGPVGAVVGGVGGAVVGHPFRLRHYYHHHHYHNHH